MKGEFLVRLKIIDHISLSPASPISKRTLIVEYVKLNLDNIHFSQQAIHIIIIITGERERGKKKSIFLSSPNIGGDAWS